MSKLTSYDAVSNHLKKYFKSEDIFVFDELVSPDFHLDVYLVKPSSERPFYTLLTSGVSSFPMNVPSPYFNPYMELMLCLPAQWPFNNDEWRCEANYWPIELLKDLGRYPHTHQTWLGFGHTIPESKSSYLFNNGFTATVLLQSSILTSDFSSIEYDGSEIDVFFPFPLYKEEYEYKKANGIESLVEKLAGSNLSEIVNLKREKIV